MKIYARRVGNKLRIIDPPITVNTQGDGEVRLYGGEYVERRRYGVGTIWRSYLADVTAEYLAAYAEYARNRFTPTPPAPTE